MFKTITEKNEGGEEEKIEVDTMSWDERRKRVTFYTWDGRKVTFLAKRDEYKSKYRR